MLLIVCRRISIIPVMIHHHRKHPTNLKRLTLMKSQGKKLRTVFAENIRACRKEKGLSQEKLAELCGLHRTYVGSVERSERNVSIDNIEKIANALRTSPSELLSRPSARADAKQ